MQIKLTTAQGRVPVTVMHVDGNIDSGTYEAFFAKAEELMNAGSRYLQIDLAQVPFVISKGREPSTTSSTGFAQSRAT